MAQQIHFRGAFIRYFDVRQSPKGEGIWVNVHMTADFSDPVREAMGWGEIPDNFTEAKLLGSLTGVEMMLKPSSRELDKYALKLQIREVKDFKVVVLAQGDDKPNENELRFTVVTSSEKANTYLGNYLKSIGKGKGRLTVSYSEQGSLVDGIEATEEQRQATLPEND
jgi:hypothetical protein